MQEVLYALVAMAIGAVFCFAGYGAFRIIFPIWGFLAGFSGGAAMVTAITGDGFLSTGLSWVVGLVMGFALGLLAYFFYAAAVVIFAGTVGYWLGAGVLLALGLNKGILTFLAGLALALVLAGIALLYGLPRLLLYVLTSLGGAMLMVTGTLLLINVVNLNEFSHGVASTVVKDSFFWSLCWLVLAVIGFVTQWQLGKAEDLAMQEAWEQ